ncbi:MAG: NeuD/PglB/VioB family sugar acetyltransferase [Gammaproteobacteria bacterium]
MNKLIIVGAGGFGRETLQSALQTSENNVSWVVSGFISDDLDVLQGTNCNYPILGRVMDWQPKEDERFIIAIGSPSDKKKAVEVLSQRRAVFTNVIHRTAVIYPSSKLGIGVICVPNVFVSDNAVIGDHVAINYGSCIGHDVSVGNYTTISSLCDVTGNVAIGESVFISSGVSIIPKVKIGDHAFICAGSTVMNDLNAHAKVLGIPARNFAIKTA